MKTENNKSVQVWPREITICGRFTSGVANPERVPELRLRGKWLKEVFSIGTRVVITCADGKLIIESAKDQPWLGRQKPMLVRQVPDDVTVAYRPGHDGAKQRKRVAEQRSCGVKIYGCRVKT